jgi:hypothetical protein
MQVHRMIGTGGNSAKNQQERPYRRNDRAPQRTHHRHTSVSQGAGCLLPSNRQVRAGLGMR